LEWGCARSLRFLQGAGGSTITSSACICSQHGEMPKGLKRYCGTGELHNITCRLPLKKEGKKTGGVIDPCTLPLQKTQGAGHPARRATSPNRLVWRGSFRLFWGSKKRAVRCFNTCITVEGVPISGSLSRRWMCSGITTYPTTTKRERSARRR